jgi:hypothetical protein
VRMIHRLRKFGGPVAASCVVVVCVAGPTMVHAADAPTDGSPTEDRRPVIALDKLLTIPSSVRIEVERRGGATRSEWRDRFVEAHGAVAEEKGNLEASLEKLSELASSGGNWKVSAPGSQASVDDTTPMNFGLNQQIRRDREAVERTERELLDLKVEANLAGVPEAWWKEQ